MYWESIIAPPTFPLETKKGNDPLGASFPLKILDVGSVDGHVQGIPSVVVEVEVDVEVEVEVEVEVDVDVDVDVEVDVDVDVEVDVDVDVDVDVEVLEGVPYSTVIWFPFW